MACAPPSRPFVSLPENWLAHASGRVRLRRSSSKQSTGLSLLSVISFLASEKNLGSSAATSATNRERWRASQDRRLASRAERAGLTELCSPCGSSSAKDGAIVVEWSVAGCYYACVRR